MASGGTATYINKFGGTLRPRINDVESSYTNTSIKQELNRFEGLSSNASQIKKSQAEGSNSEFSGQKEIQKIELGDSDSDFSNQLKG